MHEQTGTSPERMTPLSGMKEICAYVGRSESTVRKLIAREGLPAAKIGGGWESDKRSIDQWRLRRIRGC